MNRRIVPPLSIALILALSCRAAAQSTPTAPAVTGRPAASATPPPVEALAPTDDPTSDPFVEGQASEAQLAELLTHASDSQRDATYCIVDGVELKMDIYFPRNASEPTPLAVFIHGGGWRRGDKRSAVGLTDFPALLDAGFAVATLNYRLAPAYVFPAMIEDVKCAIRSFRANAAAQNIDPERIVVWGMSAGSHLSLMLGVTDPGAGFEVGQYLDQSSRVRAVVDMSGPGDLTRKFSRAFVNAIGAFGDFDLAKASPITYVTPDDPPFLIFQGDRDMVVPIGSGQAQELYDKLVATGVPAQMIVVQGGPHVLSAPDQTPTRPEMTKMIVDFFTASVK